MSKDLEDSIEKLLGSQRKGSQLNAAKESKDIFERPKKQNTQTNFDKHCQSLITKQSKPKYLLTWFGIGTFLPLDEWLDTNQAQRNGLKCKNPKISSKWSKAKEKSRRITRNETNQSQKSVPKDMGNGSTQPINKAWPLKKEAGLNTVMQWQSTGSSRKRQRLNTTDARACKSSNSPKMLNLSQYAQLPMSAALNLSTPPG